MISSTKRVFQTVMGGKYKFEFGKAGAQGNEMVENCLKSDNIEPSNARQKLDFIF